jgi:hypothetical protein
VSLIFPLTSEQPIGVSLIHAKIEFASGLADGVKSVFVALTPPVSVPSAVESKYGVIGI